MRVHAIAIVMLWDPDWEEMCRLCGSSSVASVAVLIGSDPEWEVYHPIPFPFPFLCLLVLRSLQISLSPPLSPPLSATFHTWRTPTTLDVPNPDAVFHSSSNPPTNPGFVLSALHHQLHAPGPGRSGT